MKTHFPLLDPLRLLAALSVAVFHLTFWSWAWSSINAPPGFERYVAADVHFEQAAPYTWFGWVGVEVFFVISGFVIANSANHSSARDFLSSRILRLYPAVWICATSTFIVLLLFAGGSASEFIVPYIRAVLLIPKGLNGQWIDCIYWTLAAEMAFYGLVFCALLTKTITLRHIAWGLTIYSGLFNAVALLVAWHGEQSDILTLVVLMFRVPCAAWLLSHGCFFALGIWLFISSQRKLTAPERLAVAAACLAGAAEIDCFSSFLRTNIPAISGQSPLVPILVWAAAVLAIAVAASRSRRSPSTVSCAPKGSFGTNTLRTIGLITYPLYLTHDVIGSAIIHVLVDAGLDAGVAVGSALGLLVLFCWLIVTRIEPAIRALLRNIFADFGLLPKDATRSRSRKLHIGERPPLPVRAGRP